MRRPPGPAARGGSLSPVRLVAVDVDGTLLTSAHELTAATRAAVGHARAAGIEVVLASSRGPQALAPVLRALSLYAPAVFVASQGAAVGTLPRPDGPPLLQARRPLPVALARPVLSAAERAGLAVSWYAGNAWLVSRVDDTVRREASIVGDTPQVADLPAGTEPPDKLMVIAPGSDPAPLAPVLAALPPGLQAHPSNPTYLEITAAGVDKGSALAMLMVERGLGARDVAAIGDGPNDLGMFAVAGTRIAVAGARPEVLGAATWVTASNDDDGVAAALEALRWQPQRSW